MKKLIHFIAIVSTAFSTIVCYASDYEEVGYEDLVRQISSKRRSYETKKQPTPFDDVKIHTGVGYVNSFSQMKINDKEVQRYQNGLQLALGVDLFSENWFAETTFRNFGISSYGSEELTLKELNLKLGYQDTLRDPVIFRFQGGLANRYLRLTDSQTDLSVSETTPMFTGSAGVAAKITPRVSLGFEFAAKSSLVNKSADKSAFDFTFDIKAFL